MASEPANALCICNVPSLSEVQGWASDITPLTNAKALRLQDALNAAQKCQLTPRGGGAGLPAAHALQSPLPEEFAFRRRFP